MAASIWERFFKNPPVLFPIIAILHIALFIFEANFYWTDDSFVYWSYAFRPVILLAYTVFWIAATFFKYWGALAYIILSVLNVCFYFFAPTQIESVRIAHQAFADVLLFPFPINLLFSAVLLIFLKRMR